jgi:glycosyltransferase involved in cell wall biosynthesis
VVLQAETPGALSCSSWDPDLARVGIPPAGWLARALKWPLQRIYGSATMYTCISREVRTEALGRGVSPARLVDIPHAVDVTRFRPGAPADRLRERSARGWPLDRSICVFLGRLSVEKGILDLLEAWTRVERTDALLVVVGPDMPGHPLDAGPEARSFVARRRLTDRVIFAGPTSDPAPILRAADVFIQPSHYEGFPFSVIEAMASGLPVVATRAGGMVDVLVHEENALLCAPKAPDELGQAANRLLGDEGLRKRLGNRAREDAVRLFDKDVVADAYAQVFRRLASAAG